MRRVDAITNIITSVDFGDYELKSPCFVLFDANDNLFVSVVGVIYKIDGFTGEISNFVGDPINCNTYYSPDGTQANQICLSTPKGLAFDSKGNLFFRYIISLSVIFISH